MKMKGKDDELKIDDKWKIRKTTTTAAEYKEMRGIENVISIFFFPFSSKSQVSDGYVRPTVWFHLVFLHYSFEKEKKTDNELHSVFGSHECFYARAFLQHFPIQMTSVLPFFTIDTTQSPSGFAFLFHSHTSYSAWMWQMNRIPVWFNLYDNLCFSNERE